MLTPRERRALQGLAEGETVRETAWAMGLYFTGEAFR
jgi:DNA-binding CsgD family transcriptional regulator